MAKVRVRIPQMGLTTEDVALTQWLVRVGDSVTAGQVIANLEADKATVELEAPVAGRIVELLVHANDEDLVEVGTYVAIIES